MVYSHPLYSNTQCTINTIMPYVGIGLHSGRRVTMQLHPAAPNSGIFFVRSDVPAAHAVIPASWKHVVDTRLCTVLGNEHGVTIGTVEHLLAAIRSCGVDNLMIEISADEVPILDGSCAPIVQLIKQAGIVGQRLPRHGIWIEHPIQVRQGERFAILEPSATPRVTVEIDFDSAAIGQQSVSIDLIDNLFETEIAPARTFGFADELEQLRSQGLALGGSMRNAVLVDRDQVKNAEGLRFADEFARHKILDCCGDLALAEAPIFGHLHTYKPGHRLNHALLREMFAHRSAWQKLPYGQIMQRIERAERPQLKVVKSERSALK
ncbi:MAG: UDP-3-O-acyl-N-acetylglucosamine deacetylase [Gammaproteobacteria bacterium]|nr:UDP-3-O-acyl-N-acetylglucosamine deacetylase [Gammaproteobacteria bacterium]